MAEIDKVNFEENLQQNKGKSKGSERLWILLFIVGGIVMFIKGVYDIYFTIYSLSWPYVEGTIITSHIEMEREDIRERLEGERHLTYHPRITYTYELDGKVFTGNRIFFGEYGSGVKKLISSLVEKYPPGKKVKVYYDPKKPEYCALERGIRISNFFFLLVSFIFIGIGLIGYIYWDKL